MSVVAERHLRGLARTTQELADAILERREELAVVDEMTRTYTREFRSKNGIDDAWAEKKRDEADLKLDRRIEKARTRADEALEKAREAAAGKRPSPGTTKAQLLETEKARAWDRIRQQLDADFNPASIAERLRKRGDGVGLQALIEELPTYLELHRGPGEALNDAFDRKVEVYLAGVREEEEQLRRDSGSTDQEMYDQAKKAHKLFGMNAQLVEREARGIDSVTLLAGLDDQVNLED